MKQHTSDFKNEIKKMGRKLYDEVTYIKNNEQIVLHEELYKVNAHYEANLLKSVMKELEIESSVEIEKDTIVNYRMGLLVNGQYEYIDYGNYIVYNVEKIEDSDKYKMTCYDKMLYFMKNYENINIQYPINLREYIDALVQYAGLTFANRNSTFANYNRVIQSELYLDSQGNDIGYTFRDVLDEIAQATGSIVCMNNNDEVEIRYITNTNDYIDENYLKDVNVKFGEKYGPVNSIVLSRSGESDNVYINNQQSIDENGLTEIKIIDNQLMNWNDRADYLNDLSSVLMNLEYYINDFSSTGILYYEVGDRYAVYIGENSYSCVMLNDEVERKDGLQELIHTDMPEETETDYTKADKDDRKINRTYLLVDKQNQKIESMIENITTQDTKISQITQTVDELNAKITAISDITTSGETSYATLDVDTINASEPITIKIRPNLVNISYYYPNTSLYPDLSLFMKTRTLRFHNTTTDEIFDYELPDDLLYYNQNVYDEFYWDYGNGLSRTCYITKRCGYNADGSVYALSNERVDSYTFPQINLTDGNYTISLPGYNYGYLFVRLVASNIYTSQFALKVEVTSEINQKADEIGLVVNQKLDNEDFTHASIVAKINDDTSQVLIDADKINISANDVVNILAGNTINLTSKSISITSNNFSVTPDGTVTMQNANIRGILKNYSSNTGYLGVQISDTAVRLYDFTNNGIWAGNLSSTYRSSNEQTGVALVCRQGDDILIGYKTSENDSTVNPLMQFDTRDLSSPPWIKNTIDMNLFPHNDFGGLVIKNGLLVSGSIWGTTQTFEVATRFGGYYKLNFQDGLLTGWDYISS